MEDDKYKGRKNSIDGSHLTAKNNLQIGDNKTENNVTNNFHFSSAVFLIVCLLAAAIALFLLFPVDHNLPDQELSATSPVEDTLAIRRPEFSEPAIAVPVPPASTFTATPIHTAPSQQIAFIEISGGTVEYSNIVQSLLTQKIIASGVQLTNDLSSSSRHYSCSLSLDTNRKDLVRTIYFTRFYLNITIRNTSTNAVENSISLSSELFTNYKPEEIESSFRSWLVKELATHNF